MARRSCNWRPDSGLLEGQIALIAGGAGGIGEATTRLIAAAGGTVVIADKDRKSADQLAAEVSSSGGRSHVVEADLRDEAACRRVIDEAVSEFGGIDILANVAGGMVKHAPWRPVREWTTADWDLIFDLNLRYVFWLCRAAIPMIEMRGGGTIINVASINGVFGCPNQSAYGAAKAGLVNLTKTMALECARLGIRVNAVSPGMTMTAAASDVLPKATKTKLTGMTPLQQLGTPDDIARAVLFFVSPMAEHVTGQMLLVDGGISVNYPYFAPGADHF